TMVNTPEYVGVNTEAIPRGFGSTQSSSGSVILWLCHLQNLKSRGKKVNSTVKQIHLPPQIK
ncbi:hypothetical protein A2U01_0100385, partial [Trifolium medium]|nr:hypothetical protein [Trifolium medium]